MTGHFEATRESQPSNRHLLRLDPGKSECLEDHPKLDPVVSNSGDLQSPINCGCGTPYQIDKHIGICFNGGN